MNTVINTVSEKAFNEILRNNNKACYIKGYADGYLVGGCSIKKDDFNTLIGSVK